MTPTVEVNVPMRYCEKRKCHLMVKSCEARSATNPDCEGCDHSTRQTYPKKSCVECGNPGADKGVLCAPCADGIAKRTGTTKKAAKAPKEAPLSPEEKELYEKYKAAPPKSKKAQSRLQTRQINISIPKDKANLLTTIRGLAQDKNRPLSRQIVIMLEYAAKQMVTV